jgi:hypothetical protein
MKRLLLLVITLLSLMAFSTVYSQSENHELSVDKELKEQYPIKLDEISVQVGKHTDFPSGNLEVNAVHYEFTLENLSEEREGTLFVFIKADDELLPLMQKNREKEFNPNSKSFTALSNMIILGSEQKLNLKPKEKSNYFINYEVAEGQDLNAVREKAFNATLIIGNGNPLDIEANEQFQEINLINYK